MQEYASTIIYICIFTIILELILPDNKLKKYVGVLVSLIIILTIMSPIVNILKNDEVIAVISGAIDNVQSKVQTKEYDFGNLQNKLIFSNVKKDLQDEIYTKCKEKFDVKYGIKKVEIKLDDGYKIEDINVHVQQMPEIVLASEIIDYLADEYDIDAGIINVVKEG